MQDNQDCYIVAIGASAGGIDAIFNFFKEIKENSAITYIIIRHLKRDQKSHFADLLKKHTKLPIVTVEGGEKIQSSTIYLMPETHKLTIRNRTLELVERPEKEIINHSINEFFEALAEDVGDKAIGVVLSGFLMDGAHGAKAIKAKGGRVFVQDPLTAEVGTMPLQTILLDHPDIITAPVNMYSHIVDYIKEKEVRSSRQA